MQVRLFFKAYSKASVFIIYRSELLVNFSVSSVWFIRKNMNQLKWREVLWNGKFVNDTLVLVRTFCNFLLERLLIWLISMETLFMANIFVKDQFIACLFVSILAMNYDGKIFIVIQFSGQYEKISTSRFHINENINLLWVN